MNNSSLDFIKQILDKQMSMPVGRVFAYNGNQDLPKDRDLFIVLSIAEVTPYSNNNRYRPTADGLEEVQTSNTAEDIIISLMSQSTQARDRAHEAFMALKSTYAQYVQEVNKFHISTINSVRDMSFLEETANLYRFDIECRVLRAHQIINKIDYYDKFPNTSTLEANLYIEE